ncbi:hypothetical protein [Emticicia sp. C21]|uniref:hypothetical protein n=1 Tax=Emticicia sp. C21 TaxID=2302915 RepID=UPI000E351D45|nr:hypothetical protein [Emticicia sp. C21]RFS16911.1 hypothetical protein D0T08_09545 [Emticicia sp. C21]
MTKTELELKEISPSSIIDFPLIELEQSFKTKRPKELLKTKYTVGQTIILKGEKTEYNSLVEFWLSTQILYGWEGQDYFYETLIIDELWSCSTWHNYPDRVGICQIASLAKKQSYDKFLSRIFNKNVDLQYVIMNPDWDEEKVLFVDEESYYLYYFWTGE